MDDETILTLKEKVREDTLSIEEAEPLMDEKYKAMKDMNGWTEVNTDDRVSFPKWMNYMDYHNINELCDDLQFELKHIHDILNGQNCALKFSTMNKMKSFINLMSTRKKETTFQIFSQYLLSLTYQDFNKFSKKT